MECQHHEACDAGLCVARKELVRIDVAVHEPFVAKAIVRAAVPVIEFVRLPSSRERYEPVYANVLSQTLSA